MKLKSFRIWNYKSIIDSGECRLSDNDNVLVLAGQNESGKSAVLQALYDYEREELREDCERSLDVDNFEYPIMKCTYLIEKNDNLLNEFVTNNSALTDIIVKAIESLKEITIMREFVSKDESILHFDKNFSFLLREKIREDYIDSETEIETISENKTEATSETEDEMEDESNGIDMEDMENNIAEQIFQNTPKIIFFDDFCDLLPDKILISDLVDKKKDAKGYNAVKNVEKILGSNFANYQNFGSHS